MGSYLGAIWKCRYFWLSLVRMDLRSRYRGSVLGLGWSLLHPLAMTAILSIVFTHLMHQDIRRYAPRLLGGLACWQFLTKVTLQGCICFFQGTPYIRAHPLPLAVYPLRSALAELFHFLISLVVVFFMALYLLPDQFNATAVLISMVPTLILVFFLAWSMAVIAGIANVYFQDTKHLAEIFFQLWFYATPIIYPEEVLTNNGLGWLVMLNPAVPFLKLIRAPILEGHLPSLTTYAVATLIVSLTTGMAALLLARYQRRLIFHL